MGNTEFGYVRIGKAYIKHPLRLRRSPRMVVVTASEEDAHLFVRMPGRLWAKRLVKEGFDAEYEPVLTMVSGRQTDV